MTASPQSYAREIRAYLLGRLEKGHDAGDIERQAVDALPARWTDWWIFEGKRYAGFPDALARSWLEVAHQIARLRTSHSPRRRIVPAPEGEVDWLATAAMYTGGTRAFVARASAMGLDDEERRALDGWASWISRRWSAYVQQLGLPAGAPTELPIGLHPVDVDVRADSLRRFAHVSRRSRWPLLRNVVAETFRCVLEGVHEIERLPLPEDPAKLFHLVCLVRVLASIHPVGDRVRWLACYDGDNTLKLPGLTACFERSISGAEVLAAGTFPSAFVAAIERQSLNVAGRVDLWFDFEPARGGFAALLVECKSGAQKPESAIDQLRKYYAVERRRTAGRLLVLGVTEIEVPTARVEHVEREDDVVAFCSAAQLGEILRRLEVARTP